MNLSHLSIDITDTAPTPALLAELRREAGFVRQRSERHVHLYKIACVLGFPLTALLAIALVVFEIPGFPLEMNVVMIAFTLGALVSTKLLESDDDPVPMNLILALALTWLVVVGVMLFNSVGAMSENAEDLALYAIFAGSSGFVMTGLIFGYAPFVNAARQSRARLAELVELDSGDHPEACIEYDRLRQEYPEVEAYHRQLIEQDRAPTVTEYEAVKAWVSCAEERDEKRQIIEQAQAACARLRVSV